MKEKIQKYLKTKEVARNIKEYEVLDSTQKMARKMVKIQPNGTMILANHQTQGIGTHDRKWYSSKDANITFTLILYPECNILTLGEVTVEIAKCIQRVLSEKYGISVEIKEPNDIILNGKKLAGILTQTTTVEGTVQYLLIGIGLNVNQEEFPKEIENMATSLKREYQKEFEREKIIAEICNELEKCLIKENP